MSKVVSSVVKAVTNFVKDVVKAVVETVAEAVKFVANVVVGIVENVVGMVESIIKGDFKGFLSHLGSLAMTSVAVVAVVVGAFLSLFGIPVGYALLAAGIVTLDSLHNEGRLLNQAVKHFGDLEYALFHTEFIRENAMIVQSIITSVSFIFVSVVGGPLVYEYLGLTNLPFYISNSLASYSIWTDYEAAANLKNYYSDLLKEAQEAIEKAQRDYNALKIKWFNDSTNYEVGFEMQAGGILFNGGAGSNYYDCTTAHDPMARLLGMPAYNDEDLNKMVMMKDFDELAGGQNFKAY